MNVDPHVKTFSPLQKAPNTVMSPGLLLVVGKPRGVHATVGVQAHEVQALGIGAISLMGTNLLLILQTLAGFKR